jgi:hypothetical protein
MPAGRSLAFFLEMQAGKHDDVVVWIDADLS